VHILRQGAEVKDEDELKEYLRGTKFEPVLDRLAKREENGDARMRNGLSFSHVKLITLRFAELSVALLPQEPVLPF
jgi:hypothetical protein